MDVEIVIGLSHLFSNNNLLNAAHRISALKIFDMRKVEGNHCLA